VRRIAAFFQGSPDAIEPVMKSDMAGLTAAVEHLKGQGICVKILPESFAGHWLHFLVGDMKLSEMKLFHATHVFKFLSLDSVSSQRLKLEQLWLFKNFWKELLRNMRRCSSRTQLRRIFPRLLLSHIQLTVMQQKLYSKYIKAVLAKP